MMFAHSIKMTGAAAALVAVFSLTACQNIQDNPKQTAGTVLGGVGGAVVGAQFGKGTGRVAATAAGTLLGAWLGSEVGRSLDTADQQAMASATNKASAAPVGETIYWNNADSGHSGTVTPIRDGRSASGEYCREYRTTVVVDGRTEQAYGTACQQPDGTWKTVD